MSLLVNIIAAAIPPAIAFIWYHPAVLGKAWIKAADLTEEKLRRSNLALIFALSLLLSFMLGIQVNYLVIHQAHLDSIVMGVKGYGQDGSDVMNELQSFKQKYGLEFRTFRHGAFHGVLSALFFVLPVLGMQTLFERKGFRYLAIHTLYGIVALSLMGGVICQWS
ncbi:MAG: DUF1761 domain-containing protein [Bacteroidota bacterium]